MAKSNVIAHQTAIAEASQDIHFGEVFTSMIFNSATGQWEQHCLQYSHTEDVIKGYAIIGVIDFNGDYFSLNTRYMDPSTIQLRPEFDGFFQEIVELEVEPEPLPAPSFAAQLFRKVQLFVV